MYCLDTNIIIDLWRGDLSIKKRLESVSPGLIFISSVVLCELYKGAYLSKNVDFNISLITSLINNTFFVEFNFDACQIFGKEYARLSHLAKLPQEPNLMIASIAKSNNLIVVTRDKKGFKNIDIDVEEW